MEEIINSVMQSPENTNPNVLRSQLQNIGGGGGGAEIIPGVVANLSATTMTVEMPFETLAQKLSEGAIIVATVPSAPEGWFVARPFYPVSIIASPVAGLNVIALFGYSETSFVPYVAEKPESGNTITFTIPSEDTGS